jgi:hypothetical protein
MRKKPREECLMLSMTSDITDTINSRMQKLPNQGRLFQNRLFWNRLLQFFALRARHDDGKTAVFISCWTGKACLFKTSVFGKNHSKTLDTAVFL